MLQPNSLVPKMVLTQNFGFDLSANDSKLMAGTMNSEDLRSNLIEIAKQLLDKSKAGKVNWQTIGGEPENYHVHFGGETSFIVCFQSSDYAATKASISLNIKSMVAARISAEEGEENFAMFKEVFDEAHRTATGWDKALSMIQERIASDNAVGDPPGDIPI
jgi:hypothetical protein